MRWNIVQLGDMHSQRWRNGGGTTRELLALPTSADWRLRISVAEVESDGPFSVFPGVSRWFAVLHGAGVRLRMGGEEYLVECAGAPLQFDGAVAVDCLLVDGPTQDLNLMVRGRGAAMRRIAGTNNHRFSARAIVAVYANAQTTVSVDDERLVLEAGSLGWRAVDEGAQVVVESADALWMEIEP
ncbi:MAG: HutD family protein [Ramlibacter sp.]|nr:HutD family protein [Ramlibacter sp.]